MRRSAAPRTPERLIFLGYGMLGDLTWVAPRAADEIDAALTEARAEYERFSAAHAAGSPGAAGVVARAWDLAEIGRAYEDFVTAQRPVVASINARSTDEEAYAARFRLVHAWRSLAVPRSATARVAAAAAVAGSGRGRLLRPARRPAAPGRGPLRRAMPRVGRPATAVWDSRP